MADQLTVRGTLHDLEQIGTWVDDFAQRWSLPGSTVFAIQLCCEEIVSNIVRHGFKAIAFGDVGEEVVTLYLDHGDRAVILRIDDPAEPFNPLALDSPAHPQSAADASVGGLGVHLVRKFAQDVQYERRGQTNRLTMRFDLPNAGSSGSGSLTPSQDSKETEPG